MCSKRLTLVRKSLVPPHTRPRAAHEGRPRWDDFCRRKASSEESLLSLINFGADAVRPLSSPARRLLPLLLLLLRQGLQSTASPFFCRLGGRPPERMRRSGASACPLRKGSPCWREMREFGGRFGSQGILRAHAGFCAGDREGGGGRDGEGAPECLSVRLSM